MRKLAQVRVSHRSDFLTSRLHDDEVNSYRVYLKGHHISIKYKRESKLQIWRLSGKVSTHVLPVPAHRDTDFTPDRVILPRLHDTVARFRAGSATMATGVNSRRRESPQYDIFR